MARVFQILLLSLALATVAEAACDATVANDGVQACAKDLTKCSTDAGTDICAVAKCSVENLECSNVKYGEAGCCKDLESAFDAAKKAWADMIEANKDAYKDCKDEQTTWDGACGDAKQTAQASLLVLLIAAVAGVVRV